MGRKLTGNGTSVLTSITLMVPMVHRSFHEHHLGVSIDVVTARAQVHQRCRCGAAQSEVVMARSGQRSVARLWITYAVEDHVSACGSEGADP